ncbi:hypothetical protein PMAYCL1PPCAC_23228 [Pristionchus mayeri]|uniref:BTB domain-containing protein n=1 Tax=Pristionchus mayeri TaxID=1317129 RepID=A0AAN5CY94_9BILA|nr:hypothetical protein PMAYCL1PPCAC_23228 [Pristionchus mayeri]
MDQQEGTSAWGIWSSGTNEETPQSSATINNKPPYEPTFDDEIEKFIRLDTTSYDFKEFFDHKSKMLASVISVGTIKFDVELERVKVDRPEHKDFIVHVVCHREGLDPHWSCSFQCDVRASFGDSDTKVSGQKINARYKDNSLPLAIMRLPVGSIDEAFLIVQIKMTKWKGIFPRLIHDFFNQNEYTNATIVVEDQPLHVTREILSIHSAYFNNLFFNDNFADASKDEYHLTDVSYEDMMLFLNLSYPETMVGRRELFVTSIDYLERALLLCEQFSAPAIKNLAERLLRNHTEHFPGVSSTRLLYIADRFRLSDACSSQMRRLTAQADFIRLRRSDEFELLSERLLSKLLTSALEKLPPSTAPRKARIPSRTGRIGQFSDVEVDDDDFSDVEILQHLSSTQHIPNTSRAGMATAQITSWRPVVVTSSNPHTATTSSSSAAAVAVQPGRAIVPVLLPAAAAPSINAAASSKSQYAIKGRKRDIKVEEDSEDDDSEEDYQPGPSNRPAKKSAKRGVTTRSRAKRTKK